MASPLGKLLGTSPIKPIQQHMQLAQDSVQGLCELLAACADGDWKRAIEIHRIIEATVSEASALRLDVRVHMPRSLWLAMPRNDLLGLVDSQQRIAAGVQAIASPLTLRSMVFPAPIQKQIDSVCSLLADCAGQALMAIRELDEMLTQGFGKQERQLVGKMLRRLEKQITRCEKQQRQLFKQICRCEGVVSDLDAMFFYRINDALGALTRDCADVGEQLELLLAA
ncbi:MAG: DUF47 family protein [Pseudomonadota bacterium]